MAVRKNRKTVRRSLTLHRDLDAKVQKLARHQNWSANRVLEDLVEAGLAAREAEKQQFFALAERLRASDDPAEVKQLKEALARMTFGE